MALFFSNCFLDARFLLFLGNFAGKGSQNESKVDSHFSRQEAKKAPSSRNVVKVGPRPPKSDQSGDRECQNGAPGPPQIRVWTKNGTQKGREFFLSLTMSSISTLAYTSCFTAARAIAMAAVTVDATEYHYG